MCGLKQVWNRCRNVVSLQSLLNYFYTKWKKFGGSHYLYFLPICVWSKIGLKQVSKTEDWVASLQVRPQRLVISVSPCGSKQTLDDSKKKYKLRSLLNFLLKKIYTYKLFLCIMKKVLGVVIFTRAIYWKNIYNFINLKTTFGISMYNEKSFGGSHYLYFFSMNVLKKVYALRQKVAVGSVLPTT
jgi:hypothetical protein